MENIYKILPDHTGQNAGICLATLVATSGSVPQVPGSSALFSEEGLLNGTLGGGVMEGDAGKNAREAIRSGRPLLYDFLLNADINDKEGALCGGNATILLDPDPEMHVDCFREMTASLEQGRPGLMVSVVSDRTQSPIRRLWLESEHLNPPELPMKLLGKKLRELLGKQSGKQSEEKLRMLPGEQSEKQAGKQAEHWPGIEKAFASSMNKGEPANLKNEAGDLMFIEPLFPVPKLYIAGAGHIGRALAHMTRLLDFEVTVMDDRPDYANSENIPDAHHIIVKPIGEAVSEIPKSQDTFIVIVTRGHQDDAEALKACIRHDLPYIGMIGSRKKIRTLKEKFIKEGWAEQEEFERVHAPVGIEIGSVTVQEIALSISAQLVQVRSTVRNGKKREIIASVILAAGESRRMGKPKMLLPFGKSTIIGTVISNALNSVSDHVSVVLGADAKDIEDNIAELELPQGEIKMQQLARKMQQREIKIQQQVKTVLNQDFLNGMLSSVQAGLRSLPPATTAVMILLGDQPMISAEIMDRLIERYKQSEKDIIIASVNGKRGHPMIFSAKYIPEILVYGPKNSLRDLPEKNPGEVEELETGNPVILRDIDTPKDYENEKSIHN
ncbi:MAG: XdhC family protein [Bacteroidales bacterium]